MALLFKASSTLTFLGLDHQDKADGKSTHKTHAHIDIYTFLEMKLKAMVSCKSILDAQDTFLRKELISGISVRERHK